MSRFLPFGMIALLTGLLVAGCRDGVGSDETGVAGSYTLVSVNDSPLPYAFTGPPGRQVIPEGDLRLRDTTYIMRLKVLTPGIGESFFDVEEGRYLIRDSVIRMIYTHRIVGGLTSREAVPGRNTIRVRINPELTALFRRK